ncbi:unnamed protein product [Cyclocybe aegerita]|uniref:Uncharacterized protein n=1 Tax=Cyclocybe aegerita TaxID=1973307 RepID=A0A8S0XJ35_CYCAE|nr:unnamed protein product [Cyclocybe aegerita]
MILGDSLAHNRSGNDHLTWISGPPPTPLPSSSKDQVPRLSTSVKNAEKTLERPVTQRKIVELPPCPSFQEIRRSDAIQWPSTPPKKEPLFLPCTPSPEQEPVSSRHPIFGPIGFPLCGLPSQLTVESEGTNDSLNSSNGDELFTSRPVRKGPTKRDVRQYMSRVVEKVSDDVYNLLGNESGCSTDPWILSLTNAGDAEYTCWLLLRDSPLTQHKLAIQLIKLGIPFRTLLPLAKPFPPVGHRLRQMVSMDYVGYEAYNARCRRTLYSSAAVMRTALLRGGIISRIAQLAYKNEIFESATNGPSEEASAGRVRYHISPPNSSKSMTKRAYWDDDLTKQEMHIICGVYAKGSVWPTPLEWDEITAGRRNHCWTKYDEKWFLSHVEKLKTGRISILERKRGVRDWEEMIWKHVDVPVDVPEGSQGSIR